MRYRTAVQKGIAPEHHAKRIERDRLLKVARQRRGAGRKRVGVLRRRLRQQQRQREAEARRAPLACKRCGVVFKPELRQGQRIYCSRACYKAAHLQIGREWKKANREATVVHEGRRRAVRKQGLGAATYVPVEIVDRLWGVQKGRCVECRCRLRRSGGRGKVMHLDHVQPLSRGGQHIESNLQLLCPSCNMRKHNKTEIEWNVSRGRLPLSSR